MTDKKRRSLDRALQVAAEEFIARGFEAASMGVIAERARCSTTTLYEAFESKEGLFLQALSWRMTRERRPQLHASVGEPALNALLAFTAARVDYLASARMRAAFRVLAAEPRRLAPVLPEFMRSAYADLHTALTEVARGCVREGTLRRLSPDVLAYTLIAVGSYEPQTFGILYGDDTPVDAKLLLQRVFAPIVTRRGARLLAAFLERR